MLTRVKYKIVNSQSKFHSRKGVEITMRNKGKENKNEEKNDEKAKEKEQES